MTESEWVTGIREGYRTKTIQIGNATVEIHRPILTDEERQRRMKAIAKSAERLLRKED